MIVDDFENIHAGKGAYIVGAGPSLDNLRPEFFSKRAWPVFALNNAAPCKIEPMELPNPTYMVQQDRSLNCCPRQMPVFLPSIASRVYRDYPRRYTYRLEQFSQSLSLADLSAEAAIEIAKLMGCVSFVLVAFDACINGTRGYAACIGRTMPHDWDHSTFKYRIQERLRGCRAVWVLPKAGSE